MNFQTANILKFHGTLSTISGGEQTSVAYSYLDGAIDLLRRFDRLIISLPQTTNETNRVFQILTALKRTAPDTKVYGYTHKEAVDAISVWLSLSDSWHDTFGTLIDGLYVSDFDANDVAAGGVSNGAWTRADQLLAVLACHGNGYGLWAESVYPELTLGGATTSETATNIGTDPTITDSIAIKNYTSEVTDEQRSALGRQGTAEFIRDFALQTGIRLDTFVFHHAPLSNAPTNPYPELYVPLDEWRLISEETTAFGLDGFGIWTSVMGDGDRRWFLTNKENSYDFDPRSSDANVTYTRVYGKVFPTEFGSSFTDLTLIYRRSAGELNSNPYLDRHGEITVTPDVDGNWQVLLGAEVSPGTVYSSLSLRSSDGCGSVTKRNVTLLGGQSYAF